MKNGQGKMVLAAAMLAVSALAGMAQDGDGRERTNDWRERLDRGAVAYSLAECGGEGVAVSWRLLSTDAEGAAFSVVRNGQTIAEGLTGATFFVDETGNDGCRYEVVSHQGERTDTALAMGPGEVGNAAWTGNCLRVPLDRPQGGSADGWDWDYRPNDASVGDVDGDGQLEIVLKWEPTNSRDNSHSGWTAPVLLDCYKLSGKRLWRINLGENIRAGAHYTQFLVWDFDGDGRAEIICKTAPNSLDGMGDFVTKAGATKAIRRIKNRDLGRTWGHVIEGEELLTAFRGSDGAALCTTWYWPNRHGAWGGKPSGTPKDYWGDERANRAERYLACVARLDERHPEKVSAVMCRGYYTKAHVWAVDFDGKELKTRWRHVSKSPMKWAIFDENGDSVTVNSPSLFGQGAHSICSADVDGDGLDEIVFGAATLDHDGRVLYSTQLGHGDALHVGDILPQHPGLEVFMPHESAPYGADLHDAQTGEILWRQTANKDTGRGLAADISAEARGWEWWSLASDTIFGAEEGASETAKSAAENGAKNAKIAHCASQLLGGTQQRPNNSCEIARSLHSFAPKVIGKNRPSVNFRIYWDGDALDELLDGTSLTKYTGAAAGENGWGRNVAPLRGIDGVGGLNPASCNGSKRTPVLSADILGDWREEAIFYDADTNAHLLIYSTPYPTDIRLATLLHDPQYRFGVASENVAYNQPPHLSFWLAGRTGAGK